jgi:zinc protease
MLTHLRARHIASLLLLVPSIAAAQTSASSALVPEKPLAIDTAVTVGTLSNGIRYYLRVNGEPEKRAELRLVVKAGSILEDENQRGVAHFLEHMAFNGTKNFERQELIQYLESIGMRFGGDLNASTSYEHTLYRLTVPTDTPEPLEKGLQIMEDWAHGITLDADAIQKERGVVLSEWRQRLGAGTRIRAHTDSVLLGGSRFLDRQPIGVPKIIETVARDEFLRFYKDWYRPDLMSIVVVGDIDKSATEALIRRHFGNIPAPRKKRPRPEFTIPSHPATLVSIVSDPEATGWSVQLVQKYQPSPVNTVARTRASIAESMFESILNHRLRELATKAEAPFLGARTNFEGYLAGLRAHTVVSVTVRKNELETGLELALREVERIAQHGITAEELEREKRSTKSRYDQAMITRSKISSASRAGAYVDHFLFESTPASTEEAVARARALLATITAEEIASLAKRWHSRENLAVIAVMPEKDGVEPPTADALLAVLDAVQGTAVPAQREEIVAERSLMEMLPTPGTVKQESTIREVGITQWTLSNGVRVYLKPTTHSPDQILVSGYSWGGTSLLPDDALSDAALARVLPAISGLGKFSSTALRTAMVGKLVNSGMQFGPYSQGVSGQSTVRDLETMFQLVNMHFTAPQVDTGAVRAWQRRTRTSIEGRASSPQSHFRDTLSRILSQGHPRSRPLRVEQVDSIDMGSALEIYKDGFADPGDFNFVIVGSFDIDSIRPLVARYLGGIPAAPRGDDGWRDTGLRYPSGVVEKEFRFGREPRSRTAIVFHGPFSHPVESNFAFGAMAQVLTKRLRERLREDLGGTYSVVAQAAIHSIPERRYTVEVIFDAAPERATELTKAIFAEVEALRKSGPTKAEVDKVREEWTRQMELAVKNNNFWLQTIMTYVQMERPLEDLDSHDAPLKALTPARVHEMAKQYLNSDQYVRVTQLPSSGIAHAVEGSTLRLQTRK